MINARQRAIASAIVSIIKDHADELKLMQCTDAVTGESVMTVAIAGLVDGELRMTPLCKLFDKDPYTELLPPVLSTHHKYYVDARHDAQQEADAKGASAIVRATGGGFAVLTAGTMDAVRAEAGECEIIDSFVAN